MQITFCQEVLNAVLSQQSDVAFPEFYDKTTALGETCAHFANLNERLISTVVFLKHILIVKIRKTNDARISLKWSSSLKKWLKCIAYISKKIYKICITEYVLSVENVMLDKKKALKTAKDSISVKYKILCAI